MPTHERQQRRNAVYRKARHAAILGLSLNLFLAIGKLIAGMISGTFALIADAANSLGDVVVSLVVLGAIGYAQRPPDKEHPYGHSKAEAVAATNVALLLIITAVFIGVEAIRRLPDPGSPVPNWTLWVAGANVVIKEVVYRYKRGVGKKTGSATLTAAAWDHRADAFASLAVLIGIAITIFGGPSYHWAQDVAALLVSIGIALTGFQLFYSAIRNAMDSQADDDLVKQIEALANATPDVVAIESLRVRKSGMEYFADIHVEVPGDMSVEDGHRVGHAVKDRLLDEFAMMRDVAIHVEPAGQVTSPSDSGQGSSQDTRIDPSPSSAH